MESLVDRVFDLIDMLFNDSDGELPFVSVDTKSSVEYAIKVSYQQFSKYLTGI